MKRILPLFSLFVFCAGYSQGTLDYDSQTGSYTATRTANTASSYYAGAYNSNSAEIGTYANGSGGGYVGDPGVAMFRTFTTASSANSGTARPMQVGDEFSITCYVANSTSFFNNSSAGISFNGGTASSALSNYNTLQRARFQINKNDGGLNGNWFSAALGNGSGYASPGQDVTFKIKLTSAKTVNMSISSASGATSYDMVLANAPGLSNNIQSFAIWNQTSGASNDMYWKNASLKATGTVEIGNSNGTSVFDGAITDGYLPNSTTAVVANSVIKSGSGTITFSANNTYTGTTRINSGSIKLSGSGTLGVGSNVYISSGASLDLNGVNATVASVQEAGSNNGGTIALGSGTLTVSGGWPGSIYQNSISGTGGLVKQGTGTLTLYGTQTFSGDVSVSGGELAASVPLLSSNYIINGGALSWNAANIIPDAATVTLSSGTLNVNQDETINNLSISGGKVIVAPGKILTINGDLTLTLENQISLGTGAAIRYGSSGKLIYNASGAVWVSAKEWPTAFGPSSVAITSGAVSLTGNRTITGNLSITENCSFDLFLYSISRETLGGELAVGSGAYLLIGSTGTLPANFSTHTFAPTSTIYYNGSAGQTVAQPSSPYGNVTIANSGTKTLQGNIQLAGNFTLYNAVFDLQEYTINRLTPGGTITINNGATLKIGGTNTFPAGFANVSLTSGSNVHYAGSNQEITALSSSYGHLILSGSGAKTLAGDIVTAGNLTVNAVALNVAGGQNLTVNGNVANNDGTITFENNANLLQGTTTTVNANTGNVLVHRDGSALYRQDYTMWASPVAGQGLSVFSPNTLPDRFYIYNTGTNQFNGTASSGTFTAGKGYLIRMPNGAYMPDNTALTGTINGTPAAYQQGTATMTFNGIFAGVPNNGNVTLPLATSADGYNLVGNPYPSPISLAAFRSGNSNAIDGNVWIWRKSSSSPNSAYVTINSAGIYTGNGAPEQEDPNGILRTGQGFIVKLKSGYTTSDLVFTNSMRSADTGNQFFRMNNPAQSQPENHGIWLNLNGQGGLFSQMYTGYIDGATQDEDPGLDAPYINDKPVVLASIINAKEYTIQARALPFDTADVVPLQLRTVTAGDYTVSIDHVNGLFAQGQAVYLKDNYTNAYHNLTENSYAFSSGQGTFADRFEITFVPQAALGTGQATANGHDAIVYAEDGTIKINSGNDAIKQVQIFDVRGRKLYEAEGNGSSGHIASNLGASEQVMLVRIITNYTIITKKIVHN